MQLLLRAAEQTGHRVSAGKQADYQLEYKWDFSGHERVPLGKIDPSDVV